MSAIMLKYIIINFEAIMKVTRINAGEFGSNCWLVIDDDTGEAVVIDPSPGIEDIQEAIEHRGVKVKYILLTHSHFDHMTSCDDLRDLTGAPLAVHREDAEGLVNSYFNCSRVFMNADIVYRPAEITLDEGDKLTFGSLKIDVMHTPGHTKGSSCFIIGDAMFTGDTLFDGGIGRSDLPGGDTMKLIASLKRIKNIEGDYRLFTGHGSNTTLEKQKQYNPYLNERF